MNRPINIFLGSTPTVDNILMVVIVVLLLLIEIVIIIIIIIIIGCFVDNHSSL
jgi:hypothetical protein